MMKKYFLCMVLLSSPLTQGADVCALTGTDEMALHKAAAQGMDAGYYEVCFRCACNANLEAKDANGETPLFAAIRNHNTKVANLLIDLGADVKAVDATNRNLLHCAAENGDLTLSTELLTRGLSPNATDTTGRTPLHYAVIAQQLGSIDLLISNGANPNQWDNEGKTPIDLSDDETIKSFLKVNGAKECSDIDPLELHKLAAQKGEVEASSEVQFLCHCLPSAINQINEDGLAPLHLALNNHNLKVATLLLENGADPVLADEIFGWTPLHYAVQAKDISLVEKLILMGAPVDTADKQGVTPLQVACTLDVTAAESAELPSIASLLLEKGASLKSMSAAYGTPLHCAVNEGALSAVRLLLGKGADVNALDLNGLTPLDVAKNADVRTLLYQYGALPSCQKTSFAMFKKLFGSCISSQGAPVTKEL